MKKMILAAVLAILASTSAFAQSWSSNYGSGNIAPNVTAANPDGVFRYPFRHNARVAHNRSAHEAYAQAPERDMTGSVDSGATTREFYKGTDPDPNIRFELHREEQEGW
jgi:opacity protein-like surface antigen